MVEDRDPLNLEVDRDYVGWITLDQPGSKVNLLDASTMVLLDRLVSELESRIATGKLVAVVVRSAKPASFVHGVDVRELAALGDRTDAFDKSREGQRIFRRLERLTVPTLAAVDGLCLGGGTELILACDYRIASDDPGTRLGLPEVKLGILPGFGGSVRLPALVGIQSALDLILTGKTVSAERARRIGLLDRVVPKPRFDMEVSAFLKEILGGQVARKPRTKPLSRRLLEDTRPGRALLFSMAGRRVAAQTKGWYPAPGRALRLVADTYQVQIDHALEMEAHALADVAVTPESRSLVRIFLLQQDARRKLGEKTMSQARPVERAAVLGAGVMGGSIAELIAANDVPVLLKDIEQEALDSGLRHANQLLQKAAAKGVFSAGEAGLKFALIQGTLTYDKFSEIDLVIEAVVERMAVKQQVLQDVEDRGPPVAIFATNTSSLSVTTLAGSSRRPDRVLGIHFFNPVHRMPLVEIVRTQITSEEVLATAFAFVVALGKTPVLVADRPGFLVNRLLAPYLNETGYLLEAGADVQSVDEALEAFGMPMGPCRLLDEVGLDVAEHVSAEMARAFGDRMKAATVVADLEREGLLGRKNGRGFYRYEQGRPKGVEPVVAKRFAGAAERPDAEEIRQRSLYLMVNEAAHALEEKVVETAGELDLAMVMGIGFPPFRGGLLSWADHVGLPLIVERLLHFEERLGSRFAPAPLLRSMVEEDRTFTEAD
ncbi:MAG: enoyl-CoA hydratase/isomerase family protein [Gemmatimonadota bacterium]|nr:MAG: enoyl-CoA hydratase/isomerase family protein [Gemmatimonadota bacterium]